MIWPRSSRHIPVSVSGPLKTTCKSLLTLFSLERPERPPPEPLALFLIGEGKLECYLAENPPVEANFARAKIGLIEAKQALQQATSDEGQKANIALDAHLLLAKVFYACGQYEESLEHFVKAELNSLAEKELTL